MIADTLNLDLLDLEQFDRQFARGEFNHLVQEKKKQRLLTSKPKPVKSLKDYLPTEVVAFREVVTCKGCGKQTSYLKSWGLRTYLPRSVNTSAVNPVSQKLFGELLAAGKFGEPFITEVTYLNCPDCLTLLESPNVPD